MAEHNDLEQTRKALTDWFAKSLPQAEEIAVSELKMPGAGSSNETFFLQLNTVENGIPETKELVIRWQPGGFLVFPRDAYDMKQQFLLQQRLSKTNVPAPPVVWLEEDAAVIGAPFYIMERVDGWIPGDFPPYHQQGKLAESSDEQKAKVWYGVVDTMAGIHQLDWQAAGLEFLGAPESGEFIPRQLAFWDAVSALNGEPMPAILAETRQWLLNNRFTPEHISLCWGDARLGNMIYQDCDVVAALDWELACIGDPESDLAWFAHTDWASSAGRSSGAIPRLAGLPSIEDTIAYYEKVMGRKVENFLYYDVFAAYRLALVYTRIEQDEKYIARSGSKKGLLTTTHFAKLDGLIRS
jgi:aminoglycoside phosphotransferase (APT) family kinase protein